MMTINSSLIPLLKRHMAASRYSRNSIQCSLLHSSSLRSSSNLLGYSPMAPKVPNQTISNSEKNADASNTNLKGDKKDSWTSQWGGRIDREMAVRSNVWNMTNEKFTKLAELKGELKEHQFVLDDAAAPLQRLDLDLVDGLTVVVDAAFSQKLEAKTEKLVQQIGASHKNIQFFETKDELVAYLKEVDDKLADAVPYNVSPYLEVVRDFMEAPKGLNKEETSDQETKTKENEASFLYDVSHLTDEEKQRLASSASVVDGAFRAVLDYYRILLLRSSIKILAESWTLLTAKTDGDTDRAAVEDFDVEGEAKLSRSAVDDVVKSYVLTSETTHTHERWWTLLDRDGDGLLDESEMATVAHLTIKPYRLALEVLFREAVEARPVTAQAPPEGFWQRRKEQKAQKRLLRGFARALERHFDVELESSHRLRCIYAWAEKAHQENKIRSVHVDTGYGDNDTAMAVVAGRKRYVELSPKIAYPEFRLEQQEHFEHLDRVGREFLQSYKNDLLMAQGIGRQNQELRKEVAYFFLAVTVLDAGTYFL